MGSPIRKAGAVAAAPFTAGSALLGGAATGVNISSPARFMGTDEFRPQGSQMMGELGGLVDYNRARVTGEAPSVAQMQMREGMEQSVADTTSAIRSAPGVSPALQARMIARAGQDQGSEIARAQSILRAAEQAEAIDSQSRMIGQGLQQDLGMAGVRAQAHGDAAGRRSNLFGSVVGGLGNAIGLGGL